MTASKPDGAQLELFAQDFFAALAPPAAPPQAPQPLFKAPPKVAPPAPDTVHQQPLRQIQVGTHSIEYELRRSTRRSIGFMIDDAGLHVTAPRRVTLAEIDNAIRAKQRWILSKLRESGERHAQREARRVVWEDGARLPFLGGEIVLRLERAARSHCWFDKTERELNVGVPPGLEEGQLVERVRRWFELEAKRLFQDRLDHFAPRLGVQYRRFSLSSAGTRWGSCTVEGHIRLNWRLMHFAPGLIDYVVAHELAHLREMNHSPRFWAAVGEIFPDYEGAKAALKKRAAELPLVFP